MPASVKRARPDPLDVSRKQQEASSDSNRERFLHSHAGTNTMSSLKRKIQQESRSISHQDGLAQSTTETSGKRRRQPALVKCSRRSEDSSYVPPKSMVSKSDKQKYRSKCKSSGSPSTCARDPFQYLDDVVISCIIEHLSLKDTETIRRVSKYWKATSEFCCGRSLFQQHFSHPEPMVDRCTTREASNLLFRRTRKYIIIFFKSLSNVRSRHHLLTTTVGG